MQSVARKNKDTKYVKVKLKMWPYKRTSIPQDAYNRVSGREYRGNGKEHMD